MVPACNSYLRPDVKIEPLVSRWHAWPHLIPPVQRGLNILNRYLPALRSFIANPRVHVAASANPAMFGGPFIDLPANMVGEVKNLHAATELEQSAFTALAKDYVERQRAVVESADGYSLNDHYASTPKSLAGAVEYVYDLLNRASVRVLEPILYDRMPNALGQSIFLHSTPEDKRPFFLNTPRFKDDKSVLLDLPFDDTRIDALSQSRLNPCDVRELASLLNVKTDDLLTFETLFTSEAPSHRHRSPASHQVRFRYFGHATVLVETSDIAVLIDPVIAYEEGSPDGRLTQADLPEHIDFVVITHCHQDHFSPETLLQLRHRVGEIIVPHNNRGSLSDPSMSLILESLGFKKVRSLDEFETVTVGRGKIVSLPFLGEHSDLNIHSKQSVLVDLGGVKSLFLVDSDVQDVEFIRAVRNRIGKIDLLFMGMECNGAPLTWLYGPLLTTPISRQNDESRRLSASDSKGAIAIMESFPEAEVFIYAMGQEPWLKFMMGLEYSEDCFQMVQIRELMTWARQQSRNVRLLNGATERIYDRRDLGEARRVPEFVS